jgi:hypothetical protein
MKVALWAEIGRLAHVEKLSGRAISRRLGCSRESVAAAIKLDRPPVRRASKRTSSLGPHKAKIDALLAKYPELSAVRIREEIARGLDGYTGSTCTDRRYLRTVRPARGRVYQCLASVEMGQTVCLNKGVFQAEVCPCRREFGSVSRRRRS